MRRCYFVLMGIILLASQIALGQPLLDKLESTLPSPPAPNAGGQASGTATAIPGYLGASVDETPEPGKGVVITGVKKGAPSELSGLKEGDIIVGIDGKPCRTLEDLDLVLAKATVGTKLALQVQRAGKVEQKVVTLGRRPIEAEPATVPGAAITDPLPPPTSPAPSTKLRPSPPTIGAPGAPAATPPSLRPPMDPLNPASDPAAPAIGAPTPEAPVPSPATPTRDPALELPVPPAGERPTADPSTPSPSATDPLAPTASPSPPSETPAVDPATDLTAGRASLGIQVVPLNDETRLQYGVRSAARQGAVIVAVKPGSAADGAGLPIGGVVVSIDGGLVKNSDDLVEAISAARPGQEVELRYYQGDRVFTKSVRLAPAAARGVVTAPPRPGMNLASPDRPLLRKFEDMVESLTPGAAPAPTAGSSIFDPSRLTELHNDVKAMREQLETLDKRVKALEAKAGGMP
jgi:membrane-associated protease RseP (regulator of RpoE activity)